MTASSVRQRHDAAHPRDRPFADLVPRHSGLLLVAMRPESALDLTLQIEYGDQEGRGFFDPRLGSARREALSFAAALWESILGGDVPITVFATMENLGGTGSSALLASASAVSQHRNFGVGLPDTWYAAALANQLLGEDLNGIDVPEIQIAFNADVDSPIVLGSVGWYYGIDGNAGTDFDLVTVALHEIGHGLGMFGTIDERSGKWRLEAPSILDRLLVRFHLPFPDMRDAERLAAIVSSPELTWSGAAAIAANGSPPAIHAPDPYERGASLSHWDEPTLNQELMAPRYDRPNHDPGLLRPALADMGWPLIAATPTPRPPGSTPTPIETEEPLRSPPPRLSQRELVYVTNFDSGTVSVLDASAERTVATISTGADPYGIAAAPAGDRLYVSHFSSGLLTIISTRANRVIDALPVGRTAAGVGVSDDGRFVVVADTLAGKATVVSARTRSIRASLKTGKQPSDVSVSQDGRSAFITDYGAGTVSVIDLEHGFRRALIPADEPGILGISVDSLSDLGFATNAHSGRITAIRPDSVSRRFSTSLRLDPVLALRAVAGRSDGTAYVTSYNVETGSGLLHVFDTQAREIIKTLPVGRVPEALALSSDERLLFVANSGSNSVYAVDTAELATTVRLPVGEAPLGIAAVLVPSYCDGDCNQDLVVTSSEILSGVNVALGNTPQAVCPEGDVDTDGRITIEELVAATKSRLTSCKQSRETDSPATNAGFS